MQQPTARAEKRREVVLDAALSCFARFGYAKTSMGDIAKEAGITRPLLYQQFTGKDDLLISVLDRLANESHDRARTAAMKVETREAKLLAMVENWVLGRWSPIVQSPFVDELFAESYKISPAFEEKYRERALGLINSIIDDFQLSEIIILAVVGLRSDRPTVTKLRKRIRYLIRSLALNKDSRTRDDEEE